MHYVAQESENTFINKAILLCKDLSLSVHAH